MELDYLYDGNHSYTFNQLNVRMWVEKWCRGDVLNLFAGKVRLNVNETRVDIDPEADADHYMDAQEYIEALLPNSFDTVLLDPPYSLRQSREKYQGRFYGSFRKIQDRVPFILKKHGRVITLGFNSCGMGRSRGFEKIAVCVVCHRGGHNDTLIVVDKLVQSVLAVDAALEEADK